MGSDQHAQFILSTVFGVGNGGSMAAEEGGYDVNSIGSTRTIYIINGD
jgi:hypothetical protein